MAHKKVRLRTVFADNIASKFKGLPTSIEDIETEWCLFGTAVIMSATTVIVADVSLLQRRRVAKKELLGGTRKLKKIVVRKKWPIRPGLKINL